ncbi:hypothetical protein AAE478_004205 [Parahypoxylon ruwenzoriense]
MNMFPRVAHPASRRRLKPSKQVMPEPSDGLEEENVDVLIYLKNIKKSKGEDVQDAVQRLYPGNVAGFIQPRSISSTFAIAGTPTYVFGNDDARDLMLDYDENIDFNRHLIQLRSESGLRRKFEDAFGHEMVGPRRLDTLIDIVISLTQKYMVIRQRDLSYNMIRDTTYLNQDIFATRNRVQQANPYVHNSSLQTDLLWVTSTHYHRGVPLFENTGASSTAFFLGWYRMTINEASWLVRLAKEKDAEGQRTQLGLNFGWIVEFINQLLRWRSVIMEFMYRSPANADERGDIWKNHGGLAVDVAYDHFLQSIFKIVYAVQSGTPPEGGIDWGQLTADKDQIVRLVLNHTIFDQLPRQDLAEGYQAVLSGIYFPRNIESMDMGSRIDEPETPIDWLIEGNPIPEDRKAPDIDPGILFPKDGMQREQPRPAPPLDEDPTGTTAAGTAANSAAAGPWRGGKYTHDRTSTDTVRSAPLGPWRDGAHGVGTEGGDTPAGGGPQWRNSRLPAGFRRHSVAKSTAEGEQTGETSAAGGKQAKTSTGDQAQSGGADEAEEQADAAMAQALRWAGEQPEDDLGLGGWWGGRGEPDYPRDYASLLARIQASAGRGTKRPAAPSAVPAAKRRRAMRVSA